MKGVRNFASDLWHVYSAPARMSWTNGLMLGSTIGFGAALYSADGEIHSAMVRNRDAPVYRQVIDVGEFFEPLGFMGRTNLYWSVALVTGYVLRNDVLRTVPAELLESHLIAGGFRQAGELLVRRRRPFEKRGPRSFGEGTSFPSGHASVICELATIVSHHAKRHEVTAVTYGIAAAVVLQRVTSDSHWPSDTFLGAAYGTYVARELMTDCVPGNTIRLLCPVALCGESTGSAGRLQDGPRDPLHNFWAWAEDRSRPRTSREGGHPCSKSISSARRPWIGSEARGSEMRSRSTSPGSPDMPTAPTV